MNAPFRTGTAPAVHCHDVTLSYRRHPAVHHLTGSLALRPVPPRSFLARMAPASRRAAQGHRRALVKPTRAAASLAKPRAPDIAYLPQERWRSTAAFRCACSISPRWASGAAPDRSAVSGAPCSPGRGGARCLGLAGFENRQVGSLSGGQFQRVLFARLLPQDARLILLDGPSAPSTAFQGRAIADAGRPVAWRGPPHHRRAARPRRRPRTTSGDAAHRP